MQCGASGKQPQSGCVAKPRFGCAFCGQPWEACNDAVNPERVAPALNPFRVGSLCDLSPGLAAKDVANPGLCDAALSVQSFPIPEMKKDHEDCGGCLQNAV
jgi:hypothetical protein